MVEINRNTLFVGLGAIVVTTILIIMFTSNQSVIAAEEEQQIRIGIAVVIIIFGILTMFAGLVLP